MAVASKRDFSISYGLQTDKTGSSTGNTLFVDQVNDRVAVGLNNPSEKFEVSGNIKLSDDNILKFGTNNDLQIYYDGTLNKTIIDDSSGELKIQSDGNISFTKGTTENLAVFEVDGAVKLYYDNNLKFETTTSGVDIDGDLKLDDGGTYSTTLQMVTATANRTISFPDATGTVALVAGSSGQVIYNNAGAQAGLTSVSVGNTDEINISLTGAASTPPVSFTGTWFTGGTATTTKPQLLIEPSGTTSTAWSTSGTGLGVNAASGFSGNLLDLQVNGSSRFSIANDSTFLRAKGALFGTLTISNDNNGVYIASNAELGFFTNTNQQRVVIGNSGGITISDANNITFGTTTGTKIGTATTQKLGFYNATPVVQPTSVADATDAASAITQLNALLSRMRDLGLIAT